MTENSKMKLWKKQVEKSTWTKKLLLYITLVLLSINTLVVNYEGERNWLSGFLSVKFTSQFDSSVSKMIEKDMVITNTTFPLARKIINPEKIQKPQCMRSLSRTTPVNIKLGKKRLTWNPGLEKKQ